MAYYAALVSLIHSLEEIIHRDQCKDFFLDKNQIASVHKKLRLVLASLEDYSPKDREAADFIESRIRDAAYEAQDIIETQMLRRRRRIRKKKKKKKKTNKKRNGAYITGDPQPLLELSKVKEEVDSILEEITEDPQPLLELDKVKEEVDSILEEMMRIKEETLTTQKHNLHAIRPSIEASKVEAFVGRNATVVFDEDLMTTIKGQLCGESSRLEVIAIVGMGGLGKTTLATTIFDAKLVEERFYCRAWVTVSQDSHRRNILLAIADSLNTEKEGLREAEEKVLAEHIYKHLFGRRYLIILDDIWDTKAWSDIRKILPDNSNGSRLMITTRVSGVAVDAGCSSKFLHQMSFLNEEQSWDLLRQKVFPQEHCPRELEVIGKLIAKNCRGLPLAIVAVAGILSNVSKAQHDWENIARNVSLTAIDQNNEHLSKILSLSYNHLPHHLKPCFLYLGGFPEDQKIRVSKLIRLWVAEGFLIPTESKSLEEVGRGYLEDLVNRNLVLISQNQFYDKFKYCSIHDLLRDMCSQKAHSENFFLSLHTKNHFHREPIGNTRRVYIQTCDDSLFNPDHAPHVRCVISFAQARYFSSSFTQARDPYFSSILSDSKLLRILDVSHYISLQQDDFDESSGILKLLHLRHLEFCASRINFPPSLFKLRNIQTLIVHNGLISLPSEIWKMPQLRHVICESVILPPIPYNEIRITDGVPLLGMLQTLSRVDDFIFTRDTVDMIPNLKKLKFICFHDEVWEEFGLNNLVLLLQLESLLINCYIYKSNILSLPKNFAFPSTLIKLTLDGCKLPWKDMTVVGSLPNLQKLKLANNAFVGEEWKPIEGEFLKLKILLMEDLFDPKYWHAENTHFPCLERLYIERCDELEKIPPGFVDIPTLQYIEVYGCSLGLRSSALEIQQAQRDEGNDDFQVVVTKYNESWERIMEEGRRIDGS